MKYVWYFKISCCYKSFIFSVFTFNSLFDIVSKNWNILKFSNFIGWPQITNSRKRMCNSWWNTRWHFVIQQIKEYKWHDHCGSHLLQIHKTLILILQSSWYCGQFFTPFWWHYQNAEKGILPGMLDNFVKIHHNNFTNTCIQYETDTLLISALDPCLAQSQTLWPVEYLSNTSVYWSRISIKSRSLMPFCWTFLFIIWCEYTKDGE